MFLKIIIVCLESLVLGHCIIYKDIYIYIYIYKYKYISIDMYIYINKYIDIHTFEVIYQ